MDSSSPDFWALFLAVFLAFVSGLLVEFVIDRINRRRDRERDELRRKHVRRLLREEIAANQQILDEVRSDVGRLMDLGAVPQTSVWDGMLDEVFESFDEAQQLQRLSEIYTDVHALLRLADAYARHQASHRLPLRDRIIRLVEQLEDRIGSVLTMWVDR